MNKTVRWIIIGVVIVIALLLIFRSRFAGDDEINVTAEKVKRATITESVTASGKIYPETELRIGAGIQGEVTELFVREGDSVKKGQLLARIRGEARNANLGPLAGMIPGLSTSSSGDNTINISAPINGIVSMLSVKKGERLGGMQMGSSEFIRIADLSRMELRVDVNENDVIKVKRGDSVDVEVEAYTKRKFRGVVTQVSNSTQRREASPFSSELTSYEVRILIDSSSYTDLVNVPERQFPFRSGMNARAEIKTTRKENVLAVPISAVSSREKNAATENNADDEESRALTGELEEVVYIIDAGGKVVARKVETGIQDINYFEVISGVKEGETVITGPYTVINKGIDPDKKVKVVSRKELFQRNEQ